MGEHLGENLEYKQDKLGEHTEKIIQNTEKQLLDVEKNQILADLKKCKASENRVQVFSKYMDKYGIEALVGLIPALGDAGCSIISTIYLIGEASRLKLPIKDFSKIIGYQAADFAVGAIPIIGDIADFFFKGNKWSGKVFTNHFNKLKNEAIAKGISIEEISAIEQNKNKFLSTMEKTLDKKKKH